jgi:hypothetical protein
MATMVNFMMMEVIGRDEKGYEGLRFGRGVYGVRGLIIA